MGTYLSVFLEHKIKDTSTNAEKWELMHMYRKHIPIKSKNYNYETKVWEDVPDISDEETTSGIKLDNVFEFIYQGTVRDFFRSDEMESFQNHGLPADISDELTKYFDNELKKIEDQNKNTGYSTKWWYNESYCTINDIQLIVNKLTDEWINDIKTFINKKYQSRVDKDINAKLNLIMKSLNIPNKGIKKSGAEDPYFISKEYENYLFDEKFGDILCMKEFLSFIYDIAYNFYNDFTSDIRIVYYFS